VSLPDGLPAWLALLESRHPRTVDLGLERVAEVRDRLDLHPVWPLLTVGGTNGKGSACAYLEAALQAAGYRTGCYTSPHLLHYNERVRVDGAEVPDEVLVSAFSAVESARRDTPLTYFEHGTLAAVWLFARAGIDAAVLEVGLGGRLDAVNAFDPDCAVITTVDLDHQDYLGDTREAIGYEKAGIMRPRRPCICTDPSPPASLEAHAGAIGARLLRLGHEIGIETGPDGWLCRIGERVYPALPPPAMAGRYQYDNAAAAVAALHVLRERLPVPVQALRSGIARARCPGRFQLLPGAPRIVLDVAHNPQAARALAQNLVALAGPSRVFAVFSMLSDKDVRSVVQIMAPHVHRWHVAGLPGPRGHTGGELAAILAEFDVAPREQKDVANALRAACAEAGPTDIISVFGSFYTVAEAMQAMPGRTAV
jgi:dihydrofolate synthase / folylpolyglutamate synthase